MPQIIKEFENVMDRILQQSSISTKEEKFKVKMTMTKSQELLECALALNNHGVRYVSEGSRPKASSLFASAMEMLKMAFQSVGDSSTQEEVSVPGSAQLLLEEAESNHNSGDGVERYLVLHQRVQFVNIASGPVGSTEKLSEDSSTTLFYCEADLFQAVHDSVEGFSVALVCCNAAVTHILTAQSGSSKDSNRCKHHYLRAAKLLFLVRAVMQNSIDEVFDLQESQVVLLSNILTSVRNSYIQLVKSSQATTESDITALSSLKQWIDHAIDRLNQKKVSSSNLLDASAAA